MGIIQEIGAPATLYNWPYNSPAFSTNTLINGSAHKLAFVGRVWHPTVKTGTIAIRKVHFRCGAITLNAASEVRVSLQTISDSAGPPMQPDGTQDQFYDFKTATTSLTQNAVNATGNLSADRTVNMSADSITDADSRWVAVVWEFQAFNASDSVVISGVADTNPVGIGTGNIPVLNTAGTYATMGNRQSMLTFECDDGSFAFLADAKPMFSAISSQNIASNGAVRGAGLKFRFPSTRQISRAAILGTLPNGSDMRMVVFDKDGATELASVDIDNDAVNSTGAHMLDVSFVPITCLANAYYRLVLMGASTTAGSVSYLDVSAADHLNGLWLGTNAHWTQTATSTPTGTGDWTDTTTRVPLFGMGVSGYAKPGRIIGG